eukprot:10751831-Lingulodinium_polyedra.AAC.1
MLAALRAGPVSFVPAVRAAAVFFDAAVARGARGPPEVARQAAPPQAYGGQLEARGQAGLPPHRRLRAFGPE